MTSNVLVTTLLALAIVVFISARQIIQLPVTQRSLLMPLVLSVVLGGVFFVGHPAPERIAAVFIGAVLGVGTGLVSGQVVRLWRDEATGIVFQRGSWRYLIVLIVLLLARVLIRFVFIRSGSAIDETALNAALIAALVGNLLGRDTHIALPPTHLPCGSFTQLSSR